MDTRAYAVSKNNNKNNERSIRNADKHRRQQSVFNVSLRTLSLITISALAIYAIIFASAPAAAIADVLIKTDKTEVVDRLEEEGWRVIWGHTFDKTEWKKGEKAIKTAVKKQKPQSFLAWFTGGEGQVLYQIKQDAPDFKDKDIRKLVVKSLKKKKPIEKNNLTVEAGYARFGIWQEMCVKDLSTKKKCNKYGICWPKPYMKETCQKVDDLPAEKQFFVRYKYTEDEKKVPEYAKTPVILSGGYKTVIQTLGSGTYRGWYLKADKDSNEVTLYAGGGADPVWKIRYLAGRKHYIQSMNPGKYYGWYLRVDDATGTIKLDHIGGSSSQWILEEAVEGKYKIIYAGKNRFEDWYLKTDLEKGEVIVDPIEGSGVYWYLKKEEQKLLFNE